MRYILILIILFFNVYPGNAGIKPLAHYQLGGDGAISFASGPKTLKNSAKKGFDLNAHGNPLFFADAPGSKRLQGKGSLLFDGKQDWYHAPHAIGTAADHFVLEVWVKARTDDHDAGVGTRRASCARVSRRGRIY